jgi:hypothetical protein
MMPLKFVKAAFVVAIFNQRRDIGEVSRIVKLPVQQCQHVLDWLWRYEFGFDEMDAAPKTPLSTLTKSRWLRYLYTHNVSAEAAAASVQCSVHDVLHSCGGPVEWRKPNNRRPVVELAEVTPVISDDEADAVPVAGPQFDDPAPDVMDEHLASIRAKWTPAQRAAARVGNVKAVEVFRWTDERT